MLDGPMPARAGWHRLAVSGLEDDEPVEIRLDFGLGLVGHHALKAVARDGCVQLFVRLFKPLLALQLRRSGRSHVARLSFTRLSDFDVFQRRLREQLHLLLKGPVSGSPHGRPRRLWGWKGLQAFPTFLPATGRSSYELWRLVNLSPSRRCAAPHAHHGARTPASWTGTATVIIPTRDRADLLRRCVESILTRTNGKLPEIIIHDNGSNEPTTLALLEEYASRDGFVIRRDQLPFNFSRINNEAAEIARGDVLIFLNNDTEVLSTDWIAQLASVAVDPSVGCVGALLLERDGRIQHAGLVTGPGGIAAHVYAGLRLDQVGPMLPIVQRDVSAVTGACMAIERSKFHAAGGFDAKGLPIAFNDVDLCLRLERQGLRSVFVPEAELMHIGSASRANDDFTTGSERFRSEFLLMRERWGERLDSDPYFPDCLRLVPYGLQLRLA